MDLPTLGHLAQTKHSLFLDRPEVLDTAACAKETFAMAEKRNPAARVPLRRRSPKGESPPLTERAPRSANITAYDEAHFALYLRLLDAKSKAASEEEMLEIIRETAPRMGHDKALRVLRSHMKRAVWMSGEGYRGLLRKKRQSST
jgi:hypothetical protein